MLLLACERIIAAEPALSEADRNLGDGDHGLGMVGIPLPVGAMLVAAEEHPGDDDAEHAGFSPESAGRGCDTPRAVSKATRSGVSGGGGYSATRAVQL